MDDSEIANFNELAGLTRRYWKAVQSIRSQGMPDNERREWLELIKAHLQPGTKNEGRYSSSDFCPGDQ